ncbi:hypothetical protein SS1G_07042 [Sclerotinia sclerotiorum 1980 UF-70]|uniref:MARVEL domain-containing protein n=2 Tax=Sclerotinia sclerotiorum (strain ATCC 18683 / 1980 / Ss-1) TaxID=665079 RepID=A7ENZ3_SCLS1|nr:hypothetical protein SS1G_07042 [Sclerotinia sclerotiorum 1980 UF-70]APA10456.1 hypothetical protein sscle_06g052260 [Sclerotinia sclerotiorum 1980 UF-70]EDO04559.1 hypothetical protein SS1G_07042 [Sclerotinia sclerotiorum 1980 UF-70]
MMAIADKTHVPGGKTPLLGLRIAQLVLAIIILGLSAYGVYWLVFDGDALTLASSVISIVICVYVIVANTGAPAIYNYWAVLGLDIIAVILWVVSFPVLASQIATAVTYYDYDDYSCGYYYYYSCSYKHKRGLGVEKRAETTWETYKGIMIATAALAGIQFVLFAITLIILAINIHRHRNAGGHCVPGSTAPRQNEVEPKTQPNTTATVEQSQPEVYNPPISHTH